MSDSLDMSDEQRYQDWLALFSSSKKRFRITVQFPCGGGTSENKEGQTISHWLDFYREKFPDATNISVQTLKDSEDQ